MRKQNIKWTYMVLSIVLTMYGSFSLIYNSVTGKKISILGLVFFIFGIILLLSFITFCVIDVIRKKKNIKPIEIKENKVEALKEETAIKNNEPQINKVDKQVNINRTNNSRYDNSVTVKKSSSSYETIYVKKVGYGPILRIYGNQILDMRSNTYYFVEGNMINENGRGPVFEISSNRIRKAFGSYLYELCGNNINKVFGGYFASYNGGYIKTYDISQIFEVTGSLNNKYLLAVTAILFGSY